MFWRWVLYVMFLDISVKKCDMMIKVAIFWGEEDV